MKKIKNNYKVSAGQFSGNYAWADDTANWTKTADNEWTWNSKNGDAINGYFWINIGADTNAINLYFQLSLTAEGANVNVTDGDGARYVINYNGNRLTCIGCADGCSIDNITSVDILVPVEKPLTGGSIIRDSLKDESVSISSESVLDVNLKEQKQITNGTITRATVSEETVTIENETINITLNPITGGSSSNPNDMTVTGALASEPLAVTYTKINDKTTKWLKFLYDETQMEVNKDTKKLTIKKLTTIKGAYAPLEVGSDDYLFLNYESSQFLVENGVLTTKQLGYLEEPNSIGYPRYFYVRIPYVYKNENNEVVEEDKYIWNYKGNLYIFDGDNGPTEGIKPINRIAQVKDLLEVGTIDRTGQDTMDFNDNKLNLHLKAAELAGAQTIKYEWFDDKANWSIGDSKILWDLSKVNNLATRVYISVSFKLTNELGNTIISFELPINLPQGAPTGKYVLGYNGDGVQVDWIDFQKTIDFRSSNDHTDLEVLTINDVFILAPSGLTIDGNLDRKYFDFENDTWTFNPEATTKWDSIGFVSWDDPNRNENE